MILEGEQDDPERDRFFKKVEEALVIERKYTNLKRDLRQNRAEFIALLNKVQFVKSSFGKSRLQLDMAPEEFKKLKIKIEKALQ